MKHGGVALAQGDRIAGRYEVEGWLGQGAMAVVLRARHVVTGRLCALKLIQGHLATRPEFVELFVKEAQVGSLIGQNPHVVDVLDAGFDEARGLPYLAMELLEGESLDQRLRTQGPIAIHLARLIFQQLADALEQAHRANVVHRDLKPANLFLTTTHRGEPLMKVLDFGVAKVLEQEALRTATQIGSPAYAAPEQLGAMLRTLAAQQQITIVAGVSVATDIWALGLVAHELLTGLPQGYYWGASRGLSLGDVMMSVALEEAVPATARSGDRAHLLPRGFDAWFLRCLRKNALERWPTAREALDALDALLSFPGGRTIDESTMILIAPPGAVKAELDAPVPAAVQTELAAPLASHPLPQTQFFLETPPSSPRAPLPSSAASGPMVQDQPLHAAITDSTRHARTGSGRPTGIVAALAVGLLLVLVAVLAWRKNQPAVAAQATSSAPVATALPAPAVTVSVTADPAPLPPQGGKHWVTLDLATPGAQVTLAKSASEGIDEIMAVDGLNSGPVRLEVPGEGWRVVAIKPGFKDFDEPLVFEAGTDETATHIKLLAIKSKSNDNPGESEPLGTSQNGPGTLNMNSIPASKVLLDGRPLGQTPKVGVPVSPGSHVVTFIGSTGLKKTVTVTVGSGETKTASAKM